MWRLLLLGLLLQRRWRLLLLGGPLLLLWLLLWLLLRLLWALLRLQGQCGVLPLRRLRRPLQGLHRCLLMAAGLLERRHLALPVGGNVKGQALRRCLAAGADLALHCSSQACRRAGFLLWEGG